MFPSTMNMMAINAMQPMPMSNLNYNVLSHYGLMNQGGFTPPFLNFGGYGGPSLFANDVSDPGNPGGGYAGIPFPGTPNPNVYPNVTQPQMSSPNPGEQGNVQAPQMSAPNPGNMSTMRPNVARQRYSAYNGMFARPERY